jgi:hypothetical protein
MLEGRIAGRAVDIPPDMAVCDVIAAAGIAERLAELNRPHGPSPGSIWLWRSQNTPLEVDHDTDDDDRTRSRRLPAHPPVD